MFGNEYNQIGMEMFFINTDVQLFLSVSSCVTTYQNNLMNVDFERFSAGLYQTLQGDNESAPKTWVFRLPEKEEGKYHHLAPFFLMEKHPGKMFLVSTHGVFIDNISQHITEVIPKTREIPETINKIRQMIRLALLINWHDEKVSGIEL